MAEDEQTDRIALQWAASFLELAFYDLAGALARSNINSARFMLASIEQRGIADLTARRDEFVKQGWNLEPLVSVATNLRAVIDKANQAIEQTT
jgi:hypothetical protein